MNPNSRFFGYRAARAPEPGAELVEWGWTHLQEQRPPIVEEEEFLTQSTNVDPDYQPGLTQSTQDDVPSSPHRAVFPPWSPGAPYFDPNHPTFGGVLHEPYYDEQERNLVREREILEASQKSDITVGTDEGHLLEKEDPHTTSLARAKFEEQYGIFGDEEKDLEFTEWTEHGLKESISSIKTKFNSRLHENPTASQQRLYDEIYGALERFHQITYEAMMLANLFVAMVLDGSLDDIPCYEEPADLDVFGRRELRLLQEFSNQNFLGALTQVVSLETAEHEETTRVQSHSIEYVFEQYRKFRTCGPHADGHDFNWKPAHRQGLSTVLSAHRRVMNQSIANHVATHFYTRLQTYFKFLIELHIPNLPLPWIDNTRNNSGISSKRLSEILEFIMEEGGKDRRVLGSANMDCSIIKVILVKFEKGIFYCKTKCFIYFPKFIKTNNF